MTEPRLADVFAQALPAPSRLPADVEARLIALAADARAAGPFAPDAAAFVRGLAARAPADTPLDGWLAHVVPGDLALAMACAGGAGDAIAVFEQRFRADLDAVVRRFAAPGRSEDDLRQLLREHLFVAAADRAPRIAGYAGQGLLQNWLRVTALRAFLDLDKRRDRPREELAEGPSLLALPDGQDLELDFMKREYRAAFRAAIAEATRALEAGDRHLLRQHVSFGMGIDQLAAAYGIHRATAARRLAHAREALLRATRAALARALSLDDAELDSLLALISSRLEASLARLLTSDEREGDG